MQKEKRPIMSSYREFCESLRVGKARTEEEQILRQDEEQALPLAIGAIVQRMCDSFQCPTRQVRFVDVRSNLPTGTLESMPLFRYDPESGRYWFDVEIELRDDPDAEAYPVRLHLECAPLRHGGMEVCFGSEHFQIPEDEKAFFGCIAGAINQELRSGYAPGPRLIGAS